MRLQGINTIEEANASMPYFILYSQNKAQLRERSQSMPKRTAQKRAMAQLRTLTPVLADPGNFRPSKSRSGS
ncbi:hypothetical protein OAA_03960 [Vibrio cyclitrophicus 1F175]|nr:hypothetical protein OAA_03960 [Vibrio cyclitrophicus 1F175]PMH89478.1 hypothetical protein BCU60_06000 [Vibrio cyclitrophicus]